jgi:uncharacterized protein YdcH (DUF465 family)
MENLESRLKHLEEEHARIDKRIDGLESTGIFEDVNVVDLKKQRLHLKDEIAILKAKHNLT